MSDMLRATRESQGQPIDAVPRRHVDLPTGQEFIAAPSEGKPSGVSVGSGELDAAGPVAWRGVVDGRTAFLCRTNEEVERLAADYNATIEPLFALAAPVDHPEVVGELQQINEMLDEGQGDDEGPQGMPDFEPGMSVLAKVERCLFLLEKRRDVIAAYGDERLFDDSAPMADGEIKMTAAEDVLAWLLIEKIGVPDDEPITPKRAQETIATVIDNLSAVGPVAVAPLRLLSDRETLKRKIEADGEEGEIGAGYEMFAAPVAVASGLLERQFNALTEKWPDATLKANAHVGHGHTLVVPDVKLPQWGNFNKPVATVGAIIPTGFPQASPARFFVEKTLTKSHGGFLNNLSTPWDFEPNFEEIHYGQIGIWRPNQDTLITVVHYVAQVLGHVSRIGEHHG
ncbi:hypothetical protein [Mesorhizobium sp. M0129]|uniref:hypothetical protein n=1 Tax=Mesorhizobium sp. M0129 TaxID=2956886 RepID=UPI0033364412